MSRPLLTRVTLFLESQFSSRVPQTVIPFSYCRSSPRTDHISSSSSLLLPHTSFHTSASAFPRHETGRQRQGDRENRAPTIRTVERGALYEPVDLKTSKAYLRSNAFAKTYEGLPVWHESNYKRNFRGAYNPVQTRPDCVMYGRLVGNPCPICRDNHLLVHHENVELLKQFVEPQTGAVITQRKTKICMHQQERMEIAIGRARDRGLLEMSVPHRDYDYADYYSKELLEESRYEDVLSPAERVFLARTKDVSQRQLGRNDVVVEEAFVLDEADADADADAEDSSR